MTFLTDELACSWQKIGRPKRIVVAFSAGCDSTALLCALHKMAAQQGNVPQVLAIHVNHGLRPDAGDDALHAQQLCASLRIPFRCERLQMQGASEQEARKKRYEALFTACSAFQADVIALAHHQRDQAETVLMRLMRGAVDGLKGMSEFSQVENNGKVFHLWRPFLSIPPDTLRSALLEEGISWREDSTNQETDYLRNYVRHEILPRMTLRASRTEQHIAQAATALQEDGDCLTSMADAWLQQHAVTLWPCPFLPVQVFSALHPALQKRILRRFLLACGMKDTLDYQQLCSAVQMQNGDQVNLPGGYFLVHSGAFLHLVSPSPCTPSFDPLICLPYAGHPGDGVHHQVMPNTLWQNAQLRSRLPGDYIQPFGMQGTKSLQDYLVDHKVSRPFRDHLPLLCQGHEVLWVIGVGASEKVRISNNTNTAILLHYPGRLPMEMPEQNDKGEQNHGSDF